MGLAAIGAAGALAMGGATAIGTTVAAMGVAGGFAALSAGTVFTAIATVGAVVSAVGSVAGISELKTAGMVLGGIGGVGALANAVGAFGEAASIGSIFGGAETAAAGAPSAAGAGAGSFFDAEAGVFTNNTTGSLLNGGAAVDSMDIITQAGKLGGYYDAEAGVFTDDKGVITGSDPAFVPPKTTGATSTTPKGTVASQVKADLAGDPDFDENGAAIPKGAKKPPGVNVSGAVEEVKKEEPSFWAGNTGKLLALGTLQSAGSFLEGAFDEVKPAQAALYTAQADRNNAQTALDKRQLAVLNEGMPVARRLDVTGRVAGAPAPAAPAAPGGMINRPAGAFA